VAGLVYSRNASGLVVAEYSADESAVAAALKHHDPELELIRQMDAETMRWAWSVNRRAPDGSFELVVCWRKNGYGEPLPLSMSLVDEVQKHDRNTRGTPGNVDEVDRRVRAEHRKDYMRDAEAIVKEFGPKLDEKKMAPLPRSQSLRMARDRVRAKTPNPDLRP
jgi:hypothetical protein